MQQVKTQVETLQEKVTAQIKAEIAQAQAKIADRKKRLLDMAEFDALACEAQEQIIRRFSEFNEDIARQNLIAVIRETLRRFEEQEYPRILQKLSESPLDTGEHEGNDRSSHDVDSGEFVVQSIRSVKVSFDKAWLADETDVERYLESMRHALLEELQKGKRIQI